MRHYWWVRILSTLFVVFCIATFVFFLSKILPGDPVDLMLGELADPRDKEALRKELGLDLSLWQQYVNYFSELVRGNLGNSIARKEPVLKLIVERFPATLLLAAASLVVALCVAVPVAFLSVRWHRKWIDVLANVFALIGSSVPIFVLGPLAILVFSIQLRIFPVAGYGSFVHLVLPSLCLGVGLAALLSRILRNSMLEVLNEDFIRTAKSKGLSSFYVLTRHVFSNALLPFITILAGIFGSLLAGAVVTETLFDWPGLGKLFYTAFQTRDFPLLQGIVLWIALVYCGANLFLDFLYACIDPRVKVSK